MRSSFVALSWRPADAESLAAAAQVCDYMERRRDWLRRGSGDGWALWQERADGLPLAWLPRGSGFVAGDLFAPPTLLEQLPADPRAAATLLAREAWGGFVAMFAGGAHDPALYRDPSGRLEALAWPLGPRLFVVASDFTRPPPGLRPRRLSLNWDRIAAYVTAPQAATAQPLLDGVFAAGPGELLQVAEAGSREAIWRPAELAARIERDAEGARREAVNRVDRCVAVLVERRPRALLELSGGLDSSIVAGSIAAQGLTGRIAACVHLQVGRAEGDEQRFAEVVAARLGAALDVVDWTPGVLREADLAELGPEPWPAMGGVDVGRDRALCERLARTGASAVVSGQGGDAAFFQMPSARVAADAWIDRGLPRLLASPLLADVARRTRGSVWSVLAEGRAARRGRDAQVNLASSLVPDALRVQAGGLLHPWTAEARAAGLPPGKQLHIEAIANLQVYNGRSRHQRLADVLHPLTAQPVLELCLGLPTPALAGASYDRPFARAAFRARIPPQVHDRNVKGRTTAYFQRLVAHSVDMLRPYLIDGVLASAGLLDRDRLRQVLDPPALMTWARGADVMWAASVEAWVRHWQAQAPDTPEAARRR